MGLGIVCGIAVACFIPAYLWFIISPAFGKAEYNTAAAAAEVGSTADEDEDDEEERDHRDDLKRDLEEDEELDKQLIFHQTMMQNMSNFVRRHFLRFFCDLHKIHFCDIIVSQKHYSFSYSQNYLWRTLTTSVVGQNYEGLN